MHSSPTERQLKVAALCGLDITGLSKRSAAAVLGATLAEEVLGVVPRLPATESQCEIARQLKITSLSSFKEVATVQIQAAFVCLNEEAMRKFNFAPGMWVAFVGGPHVRESSHAIGELFQVSTIGRDGRVYFKRTNGAGAFPSQLQPGA